MEGEKMINDDRLPLKEKFLEYYKNLPIQKLAAGIIGKSEDTITNWKHEDQEFSDQITNAKSQWALDNAKKVRSKEWLLERIMKDHFSPRSELTGKEGEALHERLTDEQLDELISAKIRQIGITPADTGEGAKTKE
jgi:hypothetical protein